MNFRIANGDGAVIGLGRFSGLDHGLLGGLDHGLLGGLDNGLLGGLGSRFRGKLSRWLGRDYGSLGRTMLDGRQAVGIGSNDLACNRSAHQHQRQDTGQDDRHFLFLIHDSTSPYYMKD